MTHRSRAHQSPFQLTTSLKLAGPGNSLRRYSCQHTQRTTVSAFSRRYANIFAGRQVFEAGIGTSFSLSIALIATFPPKRLADGLKASFSQPVSTQLQGHSTRAASTSAALRGGTDIDTILSTAGWSSARTFARFYQKPIELKKKSLDISSLE